MTEDERKAKIERLEKWQMRTAIGTCIFAGLAGLFAWVYLIIGFYIIWRDSQ